MSVAYSIKGKTMIRRVYLNQHGIITLDSDMFGKRKRISTGVKGSKSKISAYEKNFDYEYDRLYHEKSAPKNADYSGMTLSEYGHIVLELTSENRRKYVHDGNVKAFDSICNFMIAKGLKFGDMLLSDIKSTHIMQWQRGCGLSPQTIATRRTYLNIVMQTAMNDDIIRKNPVPLVKLPKRVEVREKTFFEEDEIKTIIQKAKGQLKNYISLACFTGMRGSELIALKWDDVDFKRGSIRVDTRIVLGEEDRTKSGKVRYVPMFNQARKALESQMESKNGSRFVFVNKHGGNYESTHAMNYAFKKHTNSIGMRSGTIHDLRRFFNTMLKQYGYPMDFILDTMGHMDDKVNRNHYTGSINVDLSKINSIAI